jgi:hypothetical protein
MFCTNCNYVPGCINWHLIIEGVTINVTASNLDKCRHRCCNVAATEQRRAVD